MAHKKKVSNNPWSRLIGRANEEQIVINGHPVTALLDTGTQVTHISEAFCQANKIQINPLDKLVEIEGTGGTVFNTLNSTYNEKNMWRFCFIIGSFSIRVMSL